MADECLFKLCYHILPEDMLASTSLSNLMTILTRMTDGQADGIETAGSTRAGLPEASRASSYSGHSSSYSTVCVMI